MLTLMGTKIKVKFVSSPKPMGGTSAYLYADGCASFVAGLDPEDKGVRRGGERTATICNAFAPQGLAALQSPGYDTGQQPAVTVISEVIGRGRGHGRCCRQRGESCHRP